MSMVLDNDTVLHPFYEISIGGAPLSNELRRFITDIEVEESDTEADLGRITVEDINYEFSVGVNLSEGTPIKIKMGFAKNNRLVLDGEITHFEGDFRDDGVPVLVIGCIDNTNKMTKEKKSRVFKKKTVSAVVKQIAGEHGMQAKVQDTGEVIDQITQEDETDAQLLRKLADDEAFIVCIVPATNTIYFGDKITGDETIVDTISYRIEDKAIISFNPNRNEKEKQVKEENKNISDKTGKAIPQSTEDGGESGGASATSNSNSKGGVSKPTGKATASISTRTGKVNK